MVDKLGDFYFYRARRLYLPLLSVRESLFSAVEAQRRRMSASGMDVDGKVADVD